MLHCSELSGESDLQSECNQACGCRNVYLDPVCGDNDVTYFSACAAGCLNYTVQDGVKVKASLTSTGGRHTI